MLVCACVWRVGVGVGVRIGVGYLCPPVRNNIVTPCYTREGERENESGREKERENARKRQASYKQTEKHKKCLEKKKEVMRGHNIDAD